ncbi:MAG: thiamine pyrophosphate-binding protein, partial [Acidiferrobacterales bacterium]
TTAALMARYLARAGIRHVFGYPGDPNLDFMEATRHEGIEFVLARREGTAAFMADAYGQVTGLPGVCMSTLGPGSTNLVNGVACAFLDRTPMLAISGQMNTRLEPTFTHQNIDHNRLFAPITKWTARMVPEAAGTILRKAMRVAMAERPGPVHITTPIDVGAAEATDSEIRLPPMHANRDWPDAFSVDGTQTDVLKLINHAQRPVIVAGMAAKRAGASEALRALVERTGIPVTVSLKAKGILPEDHPYFAGTVDMACNALMWKFLGSADLVLAVGFDPVELIKSWSLAVPVVHIDAVPNTDQIYPADLELVGSISAILQTLADAYRGGPKWTEQAIRAHRDQLFAAYYEGRTSGKLNPSDVVDIARASFPRETLITMDVGSHKILIGQGWKAYEPGSVLATNGLSAMGFALPGAMTAKLIDRNRPVICFIGDGGFAMVQGELQLAASLGLGVVVLVLCDNTLHRIEIKQTRKNYPPVGTRFDASDIVKLAESMGCDGAPADNPSALERVLGQATNLDRPLVIEARIDPAQYNAQF